MVPDEVTLSPANSHTVIQTIIEDDLRLRAGDITIWSRLGDEPYPRRHLVICLPVEGNWVTFQTEPSFRSIHLLLPTYEGAPPLPHKTLEELKEDDLRTQSDSDSGTSTVHIHNNPLYGAKESTTDGGTNSVDQNSAGPTTSTTPPLSPPPTPPTPPTSESSESDSDMGHGSAHIPLYEGDEDPRRHWFICESTWEENQVTSED